MDSVADKIIRDLVSEIQQMSIEPWKITKRAHWFCLKCQLANNDPICNACSTDEYSLAGFSDMDQVLEVRRAIEQQVKDILEK